MNETIRVRLDEMRSQWSGNDDRSCHGLMILAALCAALDKLEELDAASPNGSHGPYQDGYIDGVNECLWNVDQVVSEKLGVE